MKVLHRIFVCAFIPTATIVLAAAAVVLLMVVKDMVE